MQRNLLPDGHGELPHGDMQPLFAKYLPLSPPHSRQQAWRAKVVRLGKLRRILCVAVCLSFAGCAPMGGREPPGEGRGRPDGGAPGAGQRDGYQDRRSLDAFAAPRQALADTAEALNLTPRQRVLWDAYQEKIGALMADQTRLAFGAPTRQGAMRQIEAKVDTVRNRLAAMEDIAQAAQRLYDTLDEGQRAVADQRLAGTLPALYSGLGETPPGLPAGRGLPGMGGFGGRGGPPGM